MKVAQFSLPLSAVLVIGLNQSALAGPQSLLDPYSNVKPPTSKKTEAKKVAPVQRPAAPSSVVISAPDLPPLKKEKVDKVEKPKKEKSVAIRDEYKPAPAPVVTKSAEPKAASTAGGGTNQEGFVAGTKEIFHGFGAAAKGAIAAPAHAMANGTKKVAGGTKHFSEKIGEGTKGMTSKVAEGSKSSGGIFVKGAKSVGHGFKAMGEKTMSVAHLGHGNAGAVAKKPVDPEIAEARKKEKALAEKVAKAPQTEKIVTEKEVPIKNEPIKADNSEGLGGKVLAMPSKMGHGIANAAAKTGGATKRVAAAPIGFFGKLNPFHHGSKAELPPIRTAGTSAASAKPAE